METYVVRIWRSPLPDAPADEVRGFVEHVGDGVERPFVGLGQLIRYLTTSRSVSDEEPSNDLSLR